MRRQGLHRDEGYAPLNGRAARLGATVALATLTVGLLAYMLYHPAHARAGRVTLEATGPVTRATKIRPAQVSIIPGSVFTVATASDATGLDPALAMDAASFLVTGQIYETLLNYATGGTLVVPGLAESWSISADGLTWTLTLRSGVRFHDGADLDAAAVVYNFQRWWDPTHPAHDGPFEYFEFLFSGFKGDPDCLLQEVRALGTDQVQLVLTRPYSPLPSVLALPALAIASPQAIQGGSLHLLPVGSGPFRFAGWTADGTIRLAGNSAYGGTGPLLETLVFQAIPDEAARLAALQSSVAQAALLDASSIPTVTLDANLKLVWQPAFNTGYLGINRTHPPLDNALVRQAVAYAIDREAIVETLYNIYGPSADVASQLLPPVLWGRDNTLDYAYDPARARSLLSQAGYTHGFTTTLWFGSGERLYLPNAPLVAQYMQSNLAAVGIEAELVTYDWATYLEKTLNGEADLFTLGWIGDTGHPDNFFYPLLCEAFSRYGPRDDALCAQLDAARAEHDPDALAAMYAAISRHVHATLPLLPIAHNRVPWILRRDVVGLTPVVVGAQPFSQVFYGVTPVDAWTGVSPEEGAELVFGENEDTSSVIAIPPSAVTETVTLAYTPLATVTPPSGLTFAGRAFALAAYRDGLLLAGFNLAKPFTVTINYSDAQVAGLPEEGLQLRAWDGARWSAESVSLLERDLVTNRLVYGASDLGAFALFARTGYSVYLPAVRVAR